MLNVKALTALLSHNRDDRLCKQWYVMTSNGTVLAHSQPANINELRKHAAVAAMTWQEHEQQQRQPHCDGEMREDPDPEPAGSLHMLMMESDASNTVMRKLQHPLLLVLEGGVPRRRAAFRRSGKRITAEGADGHQHTCTWAQEGDDDASVMSSQLQTGDDASVMSNQLQTGTCTGAIAADVLRLHRNKVDALAAAIIRDFQKVGFEVPVEGSSTVF